MKKTILFKTMLLLCALIVGNSSAWAEEVIDELDNAFTGVTGTSYSSWSGKTSNSSAVYAGNSAGGNSSIQLRSNNNNAGVVTTASGGKVKSIKVFWNSNTTATRTLNIYGKNEAYEATTDLYNNSKQGTLLGTLNIDNATERVSVLTIEGDYEFIGFRSASGALYLDKVEITWETGDTSDPSVATTVTINDSGLTNTDVYEGTEAGKLSATVKAGENPIEGATVTWTSSNTGVATIDEKGSVTLVAAGTTTITASYAGVKDVYKASSDTYELTVTNSDPNVPGTENNPYTVAQARAAIDAGTGVTGVYATGIVSKIEKVILSSGNISYYISADGTTSADQLQAYKGKSYNGEDFTSEDDIQVGDVVVIYGNLKKYNSIYEFDADNQLVSLDRPIVSTITVAETSIDVPVEGGKGTINVTYDNFNDIVADIAFYEADGTTPATYDWIEATINNENNIEYEVVENDGPSRKAYLKVYALDDNTEEVYSELITITQAKFVPAPTTNTYTLTTTVVPGRHYIIVSGEDNGYFYAMGEQKENNRGTVTITVNEGNTTISSDAGVSEFLVNVDQDGYFTIYDDNLEGYLYAAGAGTSKNWLKTQAENDEKGQWMITFDENGAAIVKANASGRNWMRYNKSDNLFSCYGSGQQDIFLYERDGDTGSQNLTVNISDACTDGEKFYTTYSAPFAYQITGATVYGVSIEEGKLSLNEITADAVIPAYSGVLISSDEPGAKDIVTAKGGAALQNDVNWLLPTLWGVTADDMTGDNLFYRLTMHNGTEIGFWWGAADGAAFNLAANKAYLAVPKDVEAREGWWFDSETTGIKTVENAASSINGEVYNLAGQRVAQPAKGLYIVNGKKVVVK